MKAFITPIYDLEILAFIERNGSSPFFSKTVKITPLYQVIVGRSGMVPYFPSFEISDTLMNE
jgi:hypothetical protein